MSARGANAAKSRIRGGGRRMETLARAPLGALRWTQGFLGRHLSVRTKLTLWYGLMCAVTLGLIGVGMKSVLDIDISQSIDSSLKLSANSIVTQLAANPGSYDRVATCTQAFHIYQGQVQSVLANNVSSSLNTPGQFEQVLLANAGSFPVETVPLKSPIHPRGVDMSGDLSVAAVALGKSGFQSETHSGETLRTYYTPLRPVQPLLAQPACLFKGSLEVLQLEHNFITTERDLEKILLLGIPLGLFIALVVGWWIARAALRPINRISRTVKTIGESRDLSRRLNFVGPYDEVGRLAETFDGMMERLENAFETQKRFIADASHELRTPLTAIRGNADLLRIAPEDERDLCVASIRREAERMSRLVNDLLLLAAADVDEQPVHKQPVDLDELLVEVYRAAQVVAGDKVTLLFEPVQPVTVHADPDRIRQLALNLLDNAIKFTPVGGTVTLSLYAEPEGARIEVSDTGIGIPPDEQEAIFRRFYRLEQSRAKRGSGLGLSICDWIVSAHGGELDLRSQVGKGTTFIVRLPGRMPEGAEATQISVTGRSAS